MTSFPALLPGSSGLPRFMRLSWYFGQAPRVLFLCLAVALAACAGDWDDYQNALEYLAKREYELALESFARIKDQNSLSLRERGLLKCYQGLARLHLKQYPQARQDLDRAIELIPDSYCAHYNRALLNIHEERHQDVAADLTASLALRSDFTPSLINRAQAYIALGRYDLALADRDRVLALKSNQSFEISLDEPDYLLAVDCIDDPGPGTRALQTAESALVQEDWKHAADLLGQYLAMPLMPHVSTQDKALRAKAMHLRALAAYHVYLLGQGPGLDRTISRHLEALGLAPQSDDAAVTLLHLGLLRTEAGLEDKADLSFDRLRELFPDSEAVKTARLELGRLLLRLGDVQGARENLEEFLREQPEHPEASPACEDLARSFLALGQPEQARSTLDYFFNREPRAHVRNPALALLAGEAALALHDKTAAVDYVWDYLNMAPQAHDAGRAYELLAGIYTEQGEGKTASLARNLAWERKPGKRTDPEPGSGKPIVIRTVELIVPRSDLGDSATSGLLSVVCDLETSSGPAAWEYADRGPEMREALVYYLKRTDLGPNPLESLPPGLEAGLLEAVNQHMRYGRFDSLAVMRFEQH